MRLASNYVRLASFVLLFSDILQKSVHTDNLSLNQTCTLDPIVAFSKVTSSKYRNICTNYKEINKALSDDYQGSVRNWQRNVK